MYALIADDYFLYGMLVVLVIIGAVMIVVAVRGHDIDDAEIDRNGQNAGRDT